MDLSEESNFDLGDDGSGQFDDLKPFFDSKTFEEMPVLMLLQYQNKKNRYEYLISKGVDVQRPDFMSEAGTSRSKAKKRAVPASSAAGAQVRSSKRLKSTPVTPIEAVQEPSENEDNEKSDEEDPRFVSIKPYFTPSEWIKMSVIAKNHALNSKMHYDAAISKGLTSIMPKFMSRTASSTCTSNTDVACIPLSPSCSSSKASTPNFLSATAGESSILNSRNAKSSVVNRGKNNFQLGQTSNSFNPKHNKFTSPAVTRADDDNNDDNEFNILSKASNSFNPKYKVTAGARPALSGNQAGVKITSPAVTREYDEDDDDGDQSQADNLSDSDSQFNCDNVFAGDENSNDDIRREIIQIAKSAVATLKPEIFEEIAAILISKGVESLDDLSLVEPAWLSSLKLKEIQLKKIINKFLSQTEKENLPKPNKMKPPQRVTPLMREVPGSNTPTPGSRPQLAEKTLATGTLDYIIQWGKMRDSLLISMEKNERPSATDRENMVLIISKDLKEIYAEKKRENPTLQITPGRRVYRKVVEAIFKEFKASFEDRLKDKVVGDGMFTLMDQIETCMENSYRGERAVKGKSAPMKGNRSAACIVPELYAPPLNKQQKAEAEQTRLELIAIYRRSNERNWDHIKEKLIESIAAQRAMIVAKKRIVADIVEKWPLLFELAGMLCHLDHITRSSVLANFQNFIENDMKDFINFLTIMSPAKILNMKINRAMAIESGSHTQLLGTIMMLAAHFKEEISVLLFSVEETTLPHEVMDEVTLPTTPCLVSSGPKPLLAKEFYLFMEGSCIGSFENASEAIMGLCATYFIFGVHYPPAASTTLTCVERLMARLTDASGLVKASTSNGTVSRGALTKVMNLNKSVEDFLKDFNEDGNF